MPTLTAGKIAEVMFEQQLETYEEQSQLIDKTDVFTPDSGDMQNSGNVMWRPVEQHAPIITGWDLTGQEQPIIEETYPAFLGLPKNDFVQQRIDDLRDAVFWQRRGRASGKQQATELNSSIASLIALQGSLFYRTNDTSGFDAISEGQAILNERQGYMSTRCVSLNTRDTKKYAEDLAGRQTVQGRPAETWPTGMIGRNVAEFDVYTGSYQPNLVGGASPDTTVTGAQSFAPQAGNVDPVTSAVTNVDYREATIPVADSSLYNIGDKVTIVNPVGGAIQALGVSDKSETGQDMTFTVANKPDGTSLTLFPKPIALDDVALNDTEKFYANVDTTIQNLAVVTRLNTDTTAKTNLFWDKDAIEVVGGDIPADLMSEFDGKKVISESLSNGLRMYMIYDAELAGLNLRYRTFVWYGLTMKDPSRAGCFVTF